MLALIAVKLMPDVHTPLIEPLFSRAAAACDSTDAILLDGSLRAILYSLQETKDDRLSVYAKVALPLALRLVNHPQVRKEESALLKAMHILYYYVKSLAWAGETDEHLIQSAMDPSFAYINRAILQVFQDCAFDQLVDIKRISLRVSDRAYTLPE